MTNPNVITQDNVLPDHVLDVGEVAAIFKCCTATVYREAKRKRLRCTKVGSRLRFQPEDVAAYLDGQTPASTAERTAWDEYVRRVVADAPPFTPEQEAALSALLDWEPDTNGAAS